ncbi:MAG: hypothetical protein V3T83_15175 [Acidobacteriota bacterium]
MPSFRSALLHWLRNYAQADERVLAAWKELVSRDFRIEEEDDEF